jgi:hypothetical protein
VCNLWINWKTRAQGLPKRRKQSRSRDHRCLLYSCTVVAVVQLGVSSQKVEETEAVRCSQGYLQFRIEAFAWGLYSSTTMTVWAPFPRTLPVQPKLGQNMCASSTHPNWDSSRVARQRHHHPASPGFAAPIYQGLAHTPAPPIVSFPLPTRINTFAHHVCQRCRCLQAHRDQLCHMEHPTGCVHAPAICLERHHQGAHHASA